MSESVVLELQSSVLAAVREGLIDCEANRRREPNMFSSVPVTALFRIRRTVEISPKLQEIVAAVLQGDRELRVDGIRIVIPTTRRYDFSPALPVFVSALGTEINVSVASLELVEDEATGQPAVLVTTESSLRPDLVVVLSCLPEPAPAPSLEEFRVDDLTDKLLYGLSVPSKHHEQIKKATRHAWTTGVARKTIGDMLPRTGEFAAPENVEKTAEQIVKYLAEHQVVQMGMF